MNSQILTMVDTLLVFDNFQVDVTLPKFKKDSPGSEASSDTGPMTVFNATPDFMGGVGPNQVGIVRRPGARLGAGGFEMVGPVMKRNNSLMARLYRKIAFWQDYVIIEPKEEKPTLTVQEFFASLKHSAEQTEVVKERADGYEAAMVKAKKAGQIALYEQLEAGLNAARMEASLVAIGLGKFLSEETVVKFVKQSSRGLRLDWMANFTRVVPEEVLAAKYKADELDIFDNYVVLHYDPEGKASKETKKEETERKKDPILFGLMRDRRRLYFVGDWIDELCDLTLDKIADAMGASAVKSLAEDKPETYREST